MKFKNIITKIALGCTILSIAVACTANYENINRDWGKVTKDEKNRDGYSIISAMNNIQNNIIPTDVNTCQFTECLLGGPLGGYFADSNSGWFQKISSYNAPNNWTRVMFQEIMTKIYPNLDDLIDATDDKIPIAIGIVMKVAGMHRVTDTYGPIPYSEIGKDGELQIKYDSQEDIYKRFFEELDAAIATLTAHQTEYIASAADMVYSGEVKKWILFANSLKLRLAMRIVYADPITAQTKAEEAVNHEVGVMDDNKENAALTLTGGKGNPIYVAAQYNSGDYNTGGDHHASADITTYMNAYKDPRRASYFLPSTFPVVEFVGLRSGILIPSASVAFQYAGIKLDTKTRLIWMNASEVMFLKAEGALRGWNMGGDAKTFYEKGVKLSFDQWEASGADAYLQNNVNFPQGYNDPGGRLSYNTTLTDVTVAWADGDFEKSLERIIIQKWIANWTLGNEAWADRRRTGYPKLMPVVFNGSRGILANDDIPRRLSYPIEEYQTNTVNVTAAVANLLGGPDNMATRVWWDKKN